MADKNLRYVVRGPGEVDFLMALYYGKPISLTMANILEISDKQYSFEQIFFLKEVRRIGKAESFGIFNTETFKYVLKHPVFYAVIENNYPQQQINKAEVYYSPKRRKGIVASITKDNVSERYMEEDID